MGIETALLGAAAASATATTAATAATAGLFGTAGAFSLGTTLGTLSTGLSLFSGLQSMQAGNAQAKQAIAQSTAQAQETTRQSVREAYQEQQAASGARRQQKLAYLASGVSLSGSPLLLMEETRNKGAANAKEVMRSGEASSIATLQEGRMQASKLKTTGRNEFISSVTGALTKYAN